MKGGGFAFLHQKFPRLSIEKLKAGKLDGLQIGELTKNANFEEAMNLAELSAWLSLKAASH